MSSTLSPVGFSFVLPALPDVPPLPFEEPPVALFDPEEPPEPFDPEEPLEPPDALFEPDEPLDPEDPPEADCEPLPPVAALPAMLPVHPRSSPATAARLTLRIDIMIRPSSAPFGKTGAARVIRYTAGPGLAVAARV